MRIAMIGMGAVGSVFGMDLFNAYPQEFFAIAAGNRAERLRAEGLQVNGENFPLLVEEPVDGVQPAEIIFVCVKNYGLQAALADMRPFVAEGTIIVPLLNGISATPTLREAFPQAKVLFGIAMGIDARRTVNAVDFTTRGVLQFGWERNREPYAPEVQLVWDILSKTPIPLEVGADMERTCWKKWMLNVGYNQVTAAVDCFIYECTEVPAYFALTSAAMQEVVELAKARGVDLTKADREETERFMAAFPRTAQTSMHQDIKAGRITEVDYFAGIVEEYGRAAGVPTPVNAILRQIVHGKEQQNRLHATAAQ